jgi:hypothetical protein
MENAWRLSATFQFDGGRPRVQQHSMAMADGVHNGKLFAHIDLKK